MGEAEIDRVPELFICQIKGLSCVEDQNTEATIEATHLIISDQSDVERCHGLMQVRFPIVERAFSIENREMKASVDALDALKHTTVSH